MFKLSKFLFVILFNISISFIYADQYSLLIFGDSLSDTGNCYELSQAFGPEIPPEPYYHQGRFCNGPIWCDYLEEDLELSILNYAVGGSLSGSHNHLEMYGYHVGGLEKQIDRFESTHLSIDSLVVLEIGANDILSLLFTPWKLDPEGIEDCLQNAIQNVEVAIKRLQNLGAKTIVIWNLPDLGLTAKVNPVKELAHVMSHMTDQYNALLLNLTERLNTTNEAQLVLHFDAHRVFHEVRKQFEDEGVNLFDYQLATTFSNPPKIEIIGSPEEKFFFYDDVHLSTLAWKRFSAHFQTFIEPLLAEDLSFASLDN